MKYRIAVIGTGYTGLVTGACLAELGNDVTCIDTDASKIALIRKGTMPFFEPGLAEMVECNTRAGRLRFCESPREGLRGVEVVFIAVGTPMADDGRADLSQVRAAAIDIAAYSDSLRIIVNKSTVPMETGDLVSGLIHAHRTTSHKVTIASNPEFLREGSAIADFMHPDRIVLGVSDRSTEQALRDLYAPLQAPVVVTDLRTAEMIKYTANAFLATRVSFINEIANICERVGADVVDVIAGIAADRRIGVTYLNPGLGFGGSCLPKDVLALYQIADDKEVSPRILGAVIEVNRTQIRRVYAHLGRLLGGIAGKRIALLGLSFKPNTDDVRESPAIALAERLTSGGAFVTVHDPVALANARRRLGDDVRYVNDCYEAVTDAHGLVIATEWEEYSRLDLDRVRRLMAGRVLFDARNLFDPVVAASHGFVYAGIGRASKVVDDPGFVPAALRTKVPAS